MEMPGGSTRGMLESFRLNCFTGFTASKHRPMSWRARPAYQQHLPSPPGFPLPFAQPNSVSNTVPPLAPLIRVSTAVAAVRRAQFGGWPGRYFAPKTALGRSIISDPGPPGAEGRRGRRWVLACLIVAILDDGVQIPLPCPLRERAV